MESESSKGAGGGATPREQLKASIDRDAKEVAEFASACLFGADEGDAVIREVFVAAYEDAVSGSADSFARGRLFAKARRLCARATERRRKETVGEATAGRDRELGSKQRALIANLRPTEREALLLKYVARLSEADVAEACGTDEASIRQRVSSAILALCRATKPGVSPPSPSDRRKEVEERLSEIIDGLAPDDLADFVAEDDASRDLVHDGERVVELVRALEADRVVDRDALFEHVIRTVDSEGGSQAAAELRPGTSTQPMGVVTAEPPKLSESPAEGRAAAEPKAETKEQKSDSAAPSAESRSLSERLGTRGRLGVALGVAAFIGLVAFLLFRGNRGASGYADSAWSGKISDVSRAFGAGSGLERCSPERTSCSPVDRGDDMPAGSILRTDGQTRAIVELKDGSRVWIDRGTEFGFDGESARRARLVHGRAIVEVSDLGSSRARIDSALGYVETSGTKASFTVDPDAFGVEVARGSVRLIDTSERGVAVHAGEEGRLEPGVPPEVSPSAYLGSAFRWSERTFAPASSEETSLAGLGELRAKKPGEDQERKGAVQLASHSTKVRIVGNVARTEIEEVFANSADDVLEGIYRFPLPPDAQIERFALDVDGHLEEGAFVDRERAGAIWRGAIVNAGGKKPVAEEIVWVRGPWRDPALLEWQRGGRFELRIFPIPRHGSRRVILAYTQVIPPSGKVRRYVYPLPHDPSGSTRVGKFDVDVEVRGLDPKTGVVARGYEMQSEALPEGGKKLRYSKDGFVANGDLSLEFALPNASQEVTAWAYEPSPDEVSAERAAFGSASSGAAAPPGAPPNVGSPFVAVALRPKLPRVADDLHRAFAIVVDSSRSMFGERYRRAVELASRLVSEMDRGDHATVLACDSTCRELPSGAALALGDRASTVRDFLTSITPEGASDVAGAIRHARETLRGAPNGSGRIVYIGDGTPTVGAVQPGFVRREIQAAVPRDFGTVTTVAVGADADVATLGALAESAGGVMVPYSPGQTVAEAVYAVLGATYGSGLAEVDIETPDGLVDVSPRRLPTIPAGGEAIFTARMTRPSVEGTLRVRGRVGGTPFEQRYPIHVEATTAKGNAFVPRLYAAMKIADLEDQPDAESRKRAIELSGRYHVASRYTSLLVLESAAMFRAFGLDQAQQTTSWTGEDEAKSTGADGELAMADAEESTGTALEKKKDEAGPPATAKGRASLGGGFRGMDDTSGGSGYAEPAPKPKAAAALPAPAKRSAPMDLAERESTRGESAYAQPPPPSPAPAAPNAYSPEGAPGGRATSPTASSAPLQYRDRAADLGTAYEVRPPPPPPRFRWVPMKKVWERVGHIVAPPMVPAAATPDAIAAAERAVEENDLKRESVKKLYTLYFLSGDLQHASDVAEKWSEHDPLDPDALTARADVAAARGDRDLAIRILGSVVDVRPGDYKAQWRLARLNRWAGRAELGCRFSMAVAQIKTGDAKLIAEAVRCSRDVGHPEVAGDLMLGGDAATQRTVDGLLAEAPQDPSALTGDFRLEARWDGGDDLDLAMLHQEGRMSWLGAPTKAVITARDVQSTSREALALRGGSVGDYVVEITRPAGHSGTIRGTVDISAPGGDHRSVPFTLDGERVRVALVKVTARSKLVPL